MKNEVNEAMLDLLCKKVLEGLNEDEERQLAKMNADEGGLLSLELTAAALSFSELDTSERLPSSLEARIIADANSYFDESAPVQVTAPQRQADVSSGSVWNWLGWAIAAAACIVLAINVYVTRTGTEISRVPAPTPTPVETLTPAQQRQQLMNSPDVVMANIAEGNVEDIAKNVGGDVVWSDKDQKGYLRIKGLPINDATKQTYQLWIFDETQDPKTPIDGGTFDITSDGEAIIPIDARLKARDPKMFAVTMEKAGGVVVSDRARIAALAKVET